MKIEPFFLQEGVFRRVITKGKYFPKWSVKFVVEPPVQTTKEIGQLVQKPFKSHHGSYLLKMFLPTRSSCLIIEHHSEYMIYGKRPDSINFVE